MKDLKHGQSLPDFDWSAFDNGASVTENQVDFEEIRNNELLKKCQNHEIIEGTVIAMDNWDVIVNIGYKCDGIIPASEFRYNPELKIGDKVEVYIESVEDSKGQLVLSHKKVRFAKGWDKINEALEKKETIQGCIKCRTKGGMIVDVFGIEAFLPGSQIDVHPIRDYDVFVGKTMEFKVVKINQEFRNVVVSHKALIEEQIKGFFGKLEKDKILEGTVCNIKPYGVFVSFVNGIKGFIHVTDLSWDNISNPQQAVSLYEKVKVIVLTIDKENFHIGLGKKQLDPYPWDLIYPKQESSEDINNDFDEQNFEEIDDFEDDNDLIPNENYFIPEPYLHTQGDIGTCPYCGSHDVHTYVDGTAGCNRCGKEFRYCD